MSIPRFKELYFINILKYILLVCLIYAISIYSAWIFGGHYCDSQYSWFYEGLYIPTSGILLIYLWINHLINKRNHSKNSVVMFDKFAVTIYITIMASFTIVCRYMF